MIRWNPRGVTVYTMADGLGNDTVDRLWSAPDGSLQMTHQTRAHVTRLRDDSFRVIAARLPEELSAAAERVPIHVLHDREGGWWISTSSGLARFSPGPNVAALERRAPSEIYDAGDGLPSSHVLWTAEDAHGNLWIATATASGGPLARWRRRTGELETWPELAQLLAGVVATAFAVDGEDVWIGWSDGTLLRFRRGGFERVRSPDGIALTCLYADRAGVLWVGTGGRGVVRVVRRGDGSYEQESFTGRQRLTSDDVRAIAQDRAGRLYVGTVRGIDRLNPATGAWTPALERCPQPGERYAWSVRAVTEAGASEWSVPLFFVVESFETSERRRTTTSRGRSRCSGVAYRRSSPARRVAPGHRRATPAPAALRGPGRGWCRRSPGPRTHRSALLPPRVVFPPRLARRPAASLFSLDSRKQTAGSAISVLIDASGPLGTASSSRRTKQDIQGTEPFLDRILELRPVAFRYRNQVASDSEAPLEFGLIAEEVAEVFPELVVFDRDGQPETVRYHLLSSLLLAELKGSAICSPFFGRRTRRAHRARGRAGVHEGGGGGPPTRSTIEARPRGRACGIENFFRVVARSPVYEEDHTVTHRIPNPLLLATALTLMLGAAAARAAPVPIAGQAIGTVKYKDKTVTLEHAYLVVGDNHGTRVRKVILSAVDIEDEIAGASSLMSAGAKLREGISFDLDETMPFVGYWMAIADQSMQVSAPLDAKLFASTVDTPQRVTGKVSFDQTASGGPKVEVSFDATVTRSFD